MVAISKDYNIAMIGFMATGKTTIARELSKSLNMKYVDLDKLIEEKINLSIPEIFSRYGQVYFRKVEKDLVKQVSNYKNTIISYGGGACLDSENLINIRRNSKVVLLEADPQTILDRTKSDATRPLLEDKNSIEDIKRIMDERRETYHKAAHIIIDTADKNVMIIRDEIIKKLNID